MVETGLQKIKTTGAKVAKFGLKLYSAVTSVASKVVKFVPIVGQPLSMAMKGALMSANVASNKIHADLGNLDNVISLIGSAAKKTAGGASIAANVLTRELSYK